MVDAGGQQNNKRQGKKRDSYLRNELRNFFARGAEKALCDADKEARISYIPVFKPREAFLHLP